MKHRIYQFALLCMMGTQSCRKRSFNQAAPETVAVSISTTAKARLFWTEIQEGKTQIISGKCKYKTSSEGFLSPSECQESLDTVDFEDFKSSLSLVALEYQNKYIPNADEMQKITAIQKLEKTIQSFEQKLKDPDLPADMRMDMETNLRLRSEQLTSHNKRQENGGPSNGLTTIEINKLLGNFNESSGLKELIVKNLHTPYAIHYIKHFNSAVNQENLTADIVWTAFFNELDRVQKNKDQLTDEEPLRSFAAQNPIHINFKSTIEFAHAFNEFSDSRFSNKVPYALIGESGIFKNGNGVLADRNYTKERPDSHDFSTGLMLNQPYCKIEVPTSKLESGYKVTERHIVSGQYATIPSRQDEMLGLMFYQDKPPQKDVADRFTLWCGILSENSLNRLSGNADINSLDFFGTSNETTNEKVFRLKHFRRVFKSEFWNLNRPASEVK
jgi:hypothetical protein